MADFPPYMNGHSYISKVLEAAKVAKVPPKFTQDFLHTKLGISSSSARAVIPFLKRIGFISDAGIPTKRYKEFRNNALSGYAIADGIREGYSKLYDTNEYAHDLSETDLEGLVLQVSNAEKGQTSAAVVKSFMALRGMADFNERTNSQTASPEPMSDSGNQELQKVPLPQIPARQAKMNLSYTINLNLPETTNAEVFDAIFQSLNRNILKEND